MKMYRNEDNVLILLKLANKEKKFLVLKELFFTVLSKKYSKVMQIVRF